MAALHFDSVLSISAVGPAVGCFREHPGNTPVSTVGCRCCQETTQCALFHTAGPAVGCFREHPGNTPVSQCALFHIAGDTVWRLSLSVD